MYIKGTKTKLSIFFNRVLKEQKELEKKQENKKREQKELERKKKKKKQKTRGIKRKWKFFKK